MGQGKRNHNKSGGRMDCSSGIVHGYWLRYVGSLKKWSVLKIAGMRAKSGHTAALIPMGGFEKIRGTCLNGIFDGVYLHAITRTHPARGPLFFLDTIRNLPIDWYLKTSSCYPIITTLNFTYPPPGKKIRSVWGIRTACLANVIMPIVTDC